MKLTIAFLIVLGSCVGFPTGVDIDWSKVTSSKVYVEPVNPVKNQVTPRVIGGTEVTPNSIPYQVAVIINGDTLCGGALVSTTSVLTVAHCAISASFVQVRLGVHNVNTNEATQVRVTSTSVIIHGNYLSSTLINDIALILLPVEVTLNNNIQTIPLAPVLVETYEGRTGFMTGWGSISEGSDTISPVLRGVNVTIMNINVCRTIYGGIMQITNLCTSGEGGVGGCDGDSGSPMEIDGDLVGIMSFASRQCEAGYPTVFTRISFFKDWVEANTPV